MVIRGLLINSNTFPVQSAAALGVSTPELPRRAEGFSGFRVIQFKWGCHSICSLKPFPTQLSPCRGDAEEAGEELHSVRVQATSLGVGSEGHCEHALSVLGEVPCALVSVALGAHQGRVR